MNASTKIRMLCLGGCARLKFDRLDDVDFNLQAMKRKMLVLVTPFRCMQCDATVVNHNESLPIGLSAWVRFSRKQGEQTRKRERMGIPQSSTIQPEHGRHFTALAAAREQAAAKRMHTLHMGC